LLGSSRTTAQRVILGGWDLAHYLLRISYNPTDRLVGVATISARATETLCRFNLDFQRRDGAGRARGDLQRPPRRSPDPRSPDDLGLGCPRADGAYLATATIGQFDLRRYRTAQGLRMYDPVDPDLYDQPVDPQDPASVTFGEIADGSLASSTARCTCVVP
jgi:hypothetical protein